MSRPISIRFILNPFSGVGRKSTIPNLLAQVFDTKEVSFDLQYTTAQGHAAILAREAVAADYDAVVIIGGDGSINEVGSELIGTDVALGIVPGGSGNGIARSLGIPMDNKSCAASDY